VATKKRYVTGAGLCVKRSEADKLISDQIAKGARLIKTAGMTFLTGEERFTHDCLKWDAYNEELLKRIFDSVAVSEEYASYGGSDIHLGDPVKQIQSTVNAKIICLDSIKERLSLFDIAKLSLPAIEQEIDVGNKVFVVHGRNEAAKQTVARFLEKLGLEPIILHEQANRGRTIIEKFEDYSLVGYAVVLLTADDVGKLASQEPKLSPRARQNVVFEWGFFMGKLGRERVCALYEEGIEQPSDLDGVVYVSLDKIGAWKLLLGKELQAAGFDIDLNKAI